MPGSVCELQAVPGAPWASILLLLGLWETSLWATLWPKAQGPSHWDNGHHFGMYLEVQVGWGEEELTKSKD